MKIIEGLLNLLLTITVIKAKVVAIKRQNQCLGGGLTRETGIVLDGVKQRRGRGWPGLCRGPLSLPVAI